MSTALLLCVCSDLLCKRGLVAGLVAAAAVGAWVGVVGERGGGVTLTFL